MGAFAAILVVPVLIVCYLFILVVLFFLVFNVDGIIASLTHNRHKKLLMRVDAVLLCLTALYYILARIFGDAVYRGPMIDILLIGLMVPAWIFDMLIMKFFHKKERTKIKLRNAVCVLLVVLGIFAFNTGIEKMCGIAPLKAWGTEMIDEYLDYTNYCRIMKITVMSYTYDNGDNPDRVYHQLKRRLERKDSDINKRNGQEPYYAILNVCEDRSGRHSDRRYDMLKLLVEHGADVNVLDEDGENVLGRLCYSYIEEEEIYRCFKLLIENGADVNVGRNTVLFHINYMIEDRELSGDLEAKRSLEKIRKLLVDNGAVEDTEK